MFLQKEEMSYTNLKTDDERLEKNLDSLVLRWNSALKHGLIKQRGFRFYLSDLQICHSSTFTKLVIIIS